MAQGDSDTPMIRRKRVTWSISDSAPPHPLKHSDLTALRCVQLRQETINLWDALRNEHFTGPGVVLQGAFLDEACLEVA